MIRIKLRVAPSKSFRSTVPSQPLIATSVGAYSRPSIESPKKEPGFVPHGEPLRSIVEMLKHYHIYTADMIAEVSSAEESTVEGWDNWLDLRGQIQSHAQRLETFLPRPVLLEDTISTESLLELCIQCYLDCVTNRHQILESIGRSYMYLWLAVSAVLILHRGRAERTARAFSATSTKRPRYIYRAAQDDISFIHCSWISYGWKWPTLHSSQL